MRLATTLANQNAIAVDTISTASEGSKIASKSIFGASRIKELAAEENILGKQCNKRNR